MNLKLYTFLTLKIREKSTWTSTLNRFARESAPQVFTAVGHPGGSLSAAKILTYLYFKETRRPTPTN